ncbi:MAG TPA: formyltetrahydrofolate deformylase [Vineibacter sp.]|nr:formyltetrahydrofolate deformylase [Vineibacter sp.]
MSFVLTLSCPDRPGIVANVGGFLASHQFNIRELAQFSDPETGLFFMRIAFDAVAGNHAVEDVRAEFEPVAAPFGMTWAIHDQRIKPRLLIMVSRFGHCLNDLLYRYSIGALPVEIVAIVSNHRDMADRADDAGIPYELMPVTPETKAAQEARLSALIEHERVDLVVLARYMQVLSPALCAALSGRIINIHHSFLPSFKGARPYHQAHARGVKLIGATAHYITDAIDEGPIIDQEAARIDHAMTPDDLAAVGRDIESVVLARAITYHLQRRVFLNGNKTVVFR